MNAPLSQRRIESRAPGGRIAREGIEIPEAEIEKLKKALEALHPAEMLELAL